MTTVPQNTGFTLFVTHVETEGRLLKIYGQLDQKTSTYIETLIQPLSVQFSQGLGCPVPQSPCLVPNVICCAMFDQVFYRARICELYQTGQILVKFIDYGNTEVVRPSDIRLLNDIESAAQLQKIPPQAREFILSDVLSIGPIWNSQAIAYVMKTLRYNELPAKIIRVIGKYHLIQLWINGQDYAHMILRDNMATSAGFEEVVRMPGSLQQLERQDQQHEQRENIVAPYDYPAVRMAAATPAPLAVQRTQQQFISAPVQESWRLHPPNNVVSPPQIKLPPLQPPQLQEANVFRSRILEIGSQHEVTVSYVEDGPLLFSVQVNSTAQELQNLMHNINSLPPQPLDEPPLLGTVCLGRYSGKKTLFRAVIMKVTEHKCKLHYVDYGKTEILPHTEIFKLPVQYISPLVLSIRFRLSNVSELTVTESMKQYFKDYVLGKTLVLHVRPSEGSPLIQYGDLYYQKNNIKDVLRFAFKDIIPKWLPPRQLTENNREIAVVTYVEACNKFYIQLDSSTEALHAVMSCVPEYAKSAPPLKSDQITPGVRCIAMCSADSLWYRAQIVSVSGDTVTVFYIDFGNEESLPTTTIRAVNDDTITKIPAQAIRCILNGYEKNPSTVEMDNSFEAAVIDKSVAMVVTGLFPGGVIVDLYDLLGIPMTKIVVKNAHSNSMNGNTNVTRESFDKVQSTPPGNVNARNDEQTKKWNKSPPMEPDIEPQKSKNLNENGNDSRRSDNRYQNRGNEKEWTTSPRQQNDKFGRDEGKNDRFPRNEPRYERSDKNERFDRLIRIGRFDRFGGSRDNRNSREGFRNIGFTVKSLRFVRNENLGSFFSGKDSDTSSRGSGGNGKRGNGDRGGAAVRGRRDIGSVRTPNNRGHDGDNDLNFKSPRANQETRYSDIKQDSDRTTENKQMDTWTKKPTPSATSSSTVIPPPNITVGAIKNCDLVFMTSPTDFHIQLSPDNLELDVVMSSIATTYEQGGKVLEQSSIKNGINCIAQYSEDQQWYRATVQSIEAAGATVLFIDFGNVETVAFDKIKEIDAASAKLTAQAIRCKLLAAKKTTWDDNENLKFKELTDGKSLEAEFVAMENDVYEILLRDNETPDQYINENFSDGIDLVAAKNAARNMGRQGRGRGQAVVATDYAPLNQKWTDLKFNPGSKQEVIITWFTNPDNFYCQSLDSKDEFQKMMNDIQRVYVGRQPITEPLEVGTPVIAVFSDDGALYRAEIVELNKAHGNIVRYIDFGNRAIVETRKTYRVEKQFFTMPKQAVNCCLKNVVPANGTNWSKVNQEEIDKCINADKYECSFHEMKDDKFVISLSIDGADVAGMLVERSIAAFAVSGPVTPENKAVDTAVDQAEIEQLPSFDISLLPGQVLRVIVSNVTRVTKFHIQLPSAAASERIIEAYMAGKDPKVMPRLSCREVCIGAGCLVKTDEGWRRAVVVNCSRTLGFDVRLIDTGANDEIPLDCMLALPGQLSYMQNQAVECCLANAVSSITLDEQFRDRVEDKEVIIAVEEVDINRLIVKLYDTEGKKIKLFENDDDEQICPICPMPILNSTQNVTVSHANHSGSVWLKQIEKLDTDGDLLAQLFDYYETSGTQLVAVPEELCAAKCSDGQWYRARVIRLTEMGVVVRFLDYGNDEAVPLESVKVLEPQFCTQSQLAIEVGLTVTLSGSEDVQQEILQTHLVDKDFVATMYNVHKKWMAELTSNEGKMSEKLISLNAVEVSKNCEIETEVPEMVVGGRYKVSCTYVDSPAQFWLQRNDEIPIIALMQEKLQEDAPKYPALTGIPEENTMCVARYSIDDQWYRAEVIDADEDITTIRFIDYGNTDVVDTNIGKIKQIPDSLKAIKRYTIKCRLDVVPFGGEDWQDVALEWFDHFVTWTRNAEALVIADSVPKRVELFFDGKSVVDLLVEKNYARKIHTEEDLIEEIVDREIDPRAAYVSHVISPSEFWIQQEKNVNDLEVMVDRFIVAEMFPKVNEIQEGLLCVAKFPEDGLWYRARVVSHSDSGTKVIYIDYGNSAVSTEIRAIPEDIAKLPTLSKKCCLALPEGIERWSEEAEVEFAKMAAEGATIFLLDVLEEKEDICVVRLTQEGEDIVDCLAALCERQIPVIEERLPPLGEENSPNVLLSHINSPSEFWTQANSEIMMLETMCDHLVAAESFLPLETIEEGTICAAQFPEDEQWYRAKVISHGDAGTEVLYIDYGNSAITTQLRVLPEEIKNMPALSKCCSLRMPEDVESWSKEACEKFIQLAADGATMFQYQILDENEPAHIILTLEDMDVAGILSELCTKKSDEAKEIVRDEILKTEAVDCNDKIEVRAEETETQHVQEIIEVMIQTVTAREQEFEKQEPTSSNNTSGIEVITISDSSELSSSSKMETSSEISTMQFQSKETSELRSHAELTNIDSITSIVEVHGSPSVNSEHEIKLSERATSMVDSYTQENAIGKSNEEQLTRPKTPITKEDIAPESISQELLQEAIVFNPAVKQNSTPFDEKVVPGSINKGIDLVVNSLNESETVEVSECTVVVKDTITSVSAITPTTELPISDKIGPGSGSPSFEIERPTTPKTPLLEKLVAGVVTLQEKMSDYDDDEILTVVTVVNIPK